MNQEINIVWLRRDLRLMDNTALNQSLKTGLPTLLIFIFDDKILEELSPADARVTFIHSELQKIDNTLRNYGTSLKILKGNVEEVWINIIKKYHIRNVFFNRDYEPYATERDEKIRSLLQQKNIFVHSFKDHVIFEPHEILKSDQTPYIIYTPYKNKWLEKFYQTHIQIDNPVFCKDSFIQLNETFPSLTDIGFLKSSLTVTSAFFENIIDYDQHRDFPFINRTTFLGPHLRFGTVSIREIVFKAKNNSVFLSELIWREFFIQILNSFPYVVTQSFKSKYDAIKWRNNEKEFQLWCEGKTGYPIVDAGMRQLNETGTMHNRVRMIVASFLIKYLLIDWRWGEAYFAEKLLDFELASNNGNWQWAAGCGCDAAPYFRVFNPIIQQNKFDKNSLYIKQWIPNYNPIMYIQPIVEHAFARVRAIETYKKGLDFSV